MYGEWNENDESASRADASQIKDIMDELRGFRPYLRRRLQYIRDSNRSLEFQDELTDIEYYLSVMADSEADLVHGIEGLRGFVSKLHEMAFRKEVPKGFKYKKEDGVSSGSSSVVDDKNSQDGEEDDVAVGDLEKRLKRGKEFQDWRITENLKSLKDPEAEPREPEPAWLTFYKETREKSGGEASTSGVIPPEQRQHISQPETPDWLQENTDDRPDPLVVAGLEGICERRVKKEEVKSILKDPSLRQNPVFRQPQPFGPGPNQVQYQVPQAAAPHIRFPQGPRPYQGPQAADPHIRFPQDPRPYQGPQAAAPFLRFPQSPQPPAQYFPGYGQPATTIPPWMLDQSEVSYQPSSYDYSRSAPLDTVMRQPPIVSTYVAGYGHINIMPPLEGTPHPTLPSQPRIRAQHSEYQVPRDVRPNPFFHPPRHQHQPRMNAPQNHHYNDLHVDQRGRSRFPAYPSTPAPSPHVFLDNESSPGWENDDNESSVSYGSYKRSQTQQKKVQFQRNVAPVRPPKNRRYFNRDQAQAKRGDVGTANQHQRSPRFDNFKRKSTVRQILEKGQQKIYKLGQHEKIAEDVEEDDLIPPSVKSPQRSDSSRSPSPPPSPKENNDLAVLVKQALSKVKSKRELDRLLKDESALNAILKGKAAINPPPKQVKKKVKVNKDVSPDKKGKRPQQKKNKETVEKTAMESPSPTKDFDGFSSESECSVVSSMSTRSATRKRANQEKNTDSVTSCPGTSRSKLRRNMAVKSGSGIKGRGSNANFMNTPKKSPSPQRVRKRVVKPLASDSEDDKDEGRASADDTATKSVEKAVKCKPSSALVQEVIDEIMNEEIQKKGRKKITEEGPYYWHHKKIVNAKGGQLIRQNDILVNPNVNKIDLGYEYNAEGVLLGIKNEIKMETDNNENEIEEMEEGDNMLSLVGNQMGDLECEVIDEIEELNVGAMPENVVEVLMEVTDDCENNGEDKSEELDPDKELENLESNENSKGAENEGSQTEV